MLNFTLNIIDTPGFGNTWEIERDVALIEQICHFFSAQSEHGVLDIDAVCFVVKASDAHLTLTKKCIFGSIMSLLGKDMASNICTLITFADCAEPAVLASLKSTNLPFGTTFSFNNSALFEENQNSTGNPLSSTFWNLGYFSFETFFQHIRKLKTRSLLLTRNVVDERNQLKTTVAYILSQVNEALLKIDTLKKEHEVVKKLTHTIKDNKNFHYTVEEIKLVKVDLKPGVYALICLCCNRTCQFPCDFPDDERKRGCSAINGYTGKCEVCPQHCDWTFHKSNRWHLSHETVKVERIYEDMKKRYEESIKKRSSIEQSIQNIKDAIQATVNNLSATMDKVNLYRTRLRKIAMTDDPLISEDYIDLMIKAEIMEQNIGYAHRIKTLEELKKMSRVDYEYAKFIKEAKNEGLIGLLEDK